MTRSVITKIMRSPRTNVHFGERLDFLTSNRKKIEKIISSNRDYAGSHKEYFFW